MSTRRLTTIEPDHRVQLPSDSAESLGLNGLAALEKTKDGILMRPASAVAWGDVFATKLPMQSGPATAEEVEASGDELIL